jgi:hypothetical protein
MDGVASMIIFLKYEGELKGNGRTKTSRNLLRSHFHKQLKTAYSHSSAFQDFAKAGLTEPQCVSGRNFMPLVTTRLQLKCSLDILMLVRPGSSYLYSGGDIDNRAKTLIDGLRKPQQPNEIDENLQVIDLDDRIYTLLEDENLLHEVKLRYETLNDFDPQEDTSIVFALIEARITPSVTNNDNYALL